MAMVSHRRCLFVPLTCINYARRPSANGTRIHPSDMHTYRELHQMLGPCCLCPMVEENGPDFMEAAIYKPVTGLFAGDYVTSCARDRCGYFGKSL